MSVVGVGACLETSALSWTPESVVDVCVVLPPLHVENLLNFNLVPGEAPSSARGFLFGTNTFPRVRSRILDSVTRTKDGRNSIPADEECRTG